MKLDYERILKENEQSFDAAKTQAQDGNAVRDYVKNKIEVEKKDNEEDLSDLRI